MTQYKLQYMEARLEGVHQEMQIMIQDMERKNQGLHTMFNKMLQRNTQMLKRKRTAGGNSPTATVQTL